MNTTLTALIVFGCLVGAVLLGRTLRRLLPEDHLTADSRDTIKLAMGLVATMAALVLGLLVSSAKGSYDTERSEVIQMAAKVAFLDRVLTNYGPEAAGARAQLSRGSRGSGAANVARRSGVPDTPGSRTRKQAMQFIVPFRVSRHTMTCSASSKNRPRPLATGLRSASVAASSAVGPLHFEADADHPCLMARRHFPRLQRARAAQCYCHPRFDDFGPRCLRRYFPDPGAGPALWRLIRISSEPMVNALSQFQK